MTHKNPHTKYWFSCQCRKQIRRDPIGPIYVVSDALTTQHLQKPKYLTILWGEVAVYLKCNLPPLFKQQELLMTSEIYEFDGRYKVQMIIGRYQKDNFSSSGTYHTIIEYIERIKLGLCTH